MTTRQNGEMNEMSPRTEMVMFAVGATNLILMALLTALTVHEKSRPAGRRAVPVTGVTLLAVAGSRIRRTLREAPAPAVDFSKPGRSAAW